MTISTSSSYRKMSRGRGKSSGWAAFDLKQRQKQSVEPDTIKDPFPPVASSLTPLVPCNSLLRNNDLSVKSFSSAVIPSVDFPTLTENGKYQKRMLVGDSSGNYNNKVFEESNHVLAVKKLKELHCWADNSLIEDILASMDNNMDKASALLKEMIANGSFEENKQTGNADLSSTSNGFPCDQMTIKNLSFGKTMDLADLSSSLEDSLKGNNSRERMADNDYNLYDDAVDMKQIMERLKSVPLEPEWEEDDVYLSHRKDALRMMRSASQHSKAATNAFLRSDHVSAQHYSLKAQEEWLTAERLNAKAAKEILSIRNSKNDVWKLDLHGLHAAEAVEALQERLQQIETQVQSNRSVSPNRVQMKNGIVLSSSLESFSCNDVDRLDIQQASLRQRPTSLQVITGVGNHSRGQAAIPIAVRSYLNENRYRFDELRPGVITVRPKFRHQ